MNDRYAKDDSPADELRHSGLKLWICAFLLIGLIIWASPIGVSDAFAQAADAQDESGSKNVQGEITWAMEPTDVLALQARLEEAPIVGCSGLRRSLIEIIAEQQRLARKITTERARIESDRLRLETLQHEIEEKRAKLKKEADELRRLLGLMEEDAQAGKPGVQGVEQLIPLIRNMRARNAAALLQTLDPATSAEAMARLGSRDAAAILAVLPPDFAGEVVKLMMKDSDQ